MNKRLIKQFIIIGIILLIIISVVSVFLFMPKPSCFDKIKNQKEEGIDCGGPCEPCQGLKNPQIIWLEVLPVKDSFYAIAAKIKNLNQNYGSGLIPFQFDFYDSFGNLVLSKTATTFLTPNQSKYLVETRIISDVEIVSAKLSFGKIKWQKLDNFELPQIIVTDKKYQFLSGQEGVFSKASGVIVNKSNYDFDEIGVDIILWGENNKLLGINNTFAHTVLSGQERFFEALWTNRILEDVVSVEMEVETNVFDSENFIKKYGGYLTE